MGEKKLNSVISNNPKKPLIEVTELFIKKFEDYAKSLGAVSIGYTRVNHSQLLKNKNALYPNTIVVTMEMDKEKIALSPSRDTEMMVFDTYHALNILTSNLAIYKPMDMLHNRDHQWVVWHTTLGLEKWLVRRKQGYFKKNTSTNNGLHQRRYGRIKAK